MSKIRIAANEWYPVYQLGGDDREIEATVEQIDRWEEAEKQFAFSQREMGELYRAAEDAAREEAARVRAERDAEAKAERQRVEREREREAKARQAKKAAMWEQIEASGGVVYDANGKRIGTVADGGYSGVRLEP